MDAAAVAEHLWNTDGALRVEFRGDKAAWIALCDAQASGRVAATLTPELDLLKLPALARQIAAANRALTGEIAQLRADVARARVPAARRTSPAVVKPAVRPLRPAVRTVPYSEALRIGRAVALRSWELADQS